MKPAISIIMPLYNAERFLRETLTSVLRQTFQEYELICINDGSNDDTANIVESFQKSDHRIRLLHNCYRSGAAFSRNRGIKEARGKYIIFLDGDDIFEEELLVLAYNKAEYCNADIVLFEYRHVISDDIYEKRKIVHSDGYISDFCSKTISIYDVKTCNYLQWSSSPCNKLFLKKFVEDNYLEFQDLSCENDVYFVDMAFFLSNRIIWLDDFRVMIYARDHSTPGRISIKRDPFCIYYAMKKVRVELEKRNIFQNVYEKYYYRAFYYLILPLKNLKSDEKIRYYSFLINEGFEQLLKPYGAEIGVDNYIADKREKFISMRMREGWEQVYSLYELFLENNFFKFCNLFQNCKTQGKHIGIWGVGGNGKKFIEFCNGHSLHIDMVFDSDVEKQGNYYGGYCIESPQKVSGVDVILSTPERGYHSVSETVKNIDENVEVLDINAYICLF